MVGGPGDPSPAAAGFVAAIRTAYDSAAAGWDDGPGRMYADLANALIAAAGPVTGQRVLDLGAGTGAAGRAAISAGAAHVVAADLAPAMLTHCPPAVRPVAADAAALPFRDHSFGLTLAAFCLGHLPDVPACLAQVRRVSSGLAVSSFAPGWTHPAKSAVDAVLAGFGYRPPDWYQAFKRQTEPRSQDPDWLRAQLAAWRLGMAHVAPFAAALSADRRAALTQAAETAVTSAASTPLTVSMLTLTAA